MNKLKGGGTLPDRASWRQLCNGLVGGTTGIFMLAMLGEYTGVPWLMAPFGATCVLLFAVPASPLAQPRNVIGGHMVTALIGIMVLYLAGNSPLALALAVGLAIMFMQALRVVHPPAGANPIVIILAGKSVIGLSFLVTPVLFGSVGLVFIASLLNNLGKQTPWPTYWHGVRRKSQKQP